MGIEYRTVGTNDGTMEHDNTMASDYVTIASDDGTIEGDDGIVVNDDGGIGSDNTGFPPYLENLENLEFCYFLFQAWKMPGICSKSSKNLEF